jgi:hypothetical protein
LPRDRNTQPPDPGVGPPPSGFGRDRDLDILQTEVTKIQVDGEYTKKFLGELQVDMRDMRERMAKVEVELKHLPSKGFIVGVVTTSLLIAGALVTIAPKLWSWAGSPITVTVPPSK